MSDVCLVDVHEVVVVSVLIIPQLKLLLKQVLSNYAVLLFIILCELNSLHKNVLGEN